MTIKEAAVKHGARKAAIMLLDTTLTRTYGVGYNDLPDTAERANTLDELEDLIEDDPVANKPQIDELVREACSWENIVGDMMG